MVPELSVAKVSGHAASHDFVSAAKNCLYKYMQASQDDTICKADVLSRTVKIMQCNRTQVTELPESICFGTAVEWLRCFYSPWPKGFSEKDAEAVHRVYWLLTENFPPAHSVQEAAEWCQDFLVAHISKLLKRDGLFVTKEPAKFSHVKSMLGPLSMLVTTFPKCAVLITLHGLDSDRQFIAHNFIMAWQPTVDGSCMAFYNTCGIETVWDQKSGEGQVAFLLRTVNDIAVMIDETVLDDGYSQEILRFCFIYRDKLPSVLEID